MDDDFEQLGADRPLGAGEQDAVALLQQAIAVISQAKPMPMSTTVRISRDEVLALLEDAAARLPDELRQARWLLREREEFLAEQRREADRLIEEVKVQAERMVSRTEIVRQANQVAQRILDDANEEARQLRFRAEDYCDQRLAGMEIVLDRIMRTVQSGRAKLQAVGPPVDTGPLPGEFPGGAGDGDELEDGFFDQDLA